MWKLFRSRYPNGSLISELVATDRGKFVVRVLVQLEGVTLTSGLAAADIVEQAEDRARERALATLELESMAESQPPAIDTQPSHSGSRADSPQEDVLSPTTLEPSQPLMPSASPSANGQAVYDREPERTMAKPPSSPAVHTYPEPSLQRDDRSKPVRSPESFEWEAAQSPPVSGSEVTSGPARDNASGEREVGSSEPLENLSELPFSEEEPPQLPDQDSLFFDEVQAGSAVSRRSTLDEFTKSEEASSSHSGVSLTEEPSSISAVSPTTEEAPSFADAPTAFSSEPPVAPTAAISDVASTGPIDFSDIIARTDTQMKRLGWTNEQGRKFLLQNYGKRSRHLLNDEELLSFLQYLEGQSD